ncbi:MAG: hypothetical protein KKC73_00085 [Proteobacteria bacterium]|nr:hypothetical protein [Pseudomonadota bacterium]
MRIPFKRQIRYIKIYLYLSKSAKEEILFKNEKPIFDIVSIAFNNEIVIKYQISLLKKYLTDNFIYTVIDNSSNFDKQQKIKEVCINHKVNYIKPPINPFQDELGSGSHGVALNWAFKHFIKPRHPKYFGFIDHDIFPISKTSILSNLSNSEIYGKVDTRGNKWYLWPGFCFFSFQFLLGKKIDFLPERGVDTGGKIWNSIYYKFDKNLIPNLSVKCEQLQPGENMATDCYETMGDWIHTINASECISAPHKNELITNLLNKYL